MIAAVRWPSEAGKLDYLRGLAVRYGEDPATRKVAQAMLSGVRDPSYNLPTTIDTLRQAVARSISYVQEAGEQIQTPPETLSRKSGDCDDQAVLIAALAHSINVPFRWSIWTGPGGDHIATELYDGRRWTLADSTLRGPMPTTTKRRLTHPAGGPNQAPSGYGYSVNEFLNDAVGVVVSPVTIIAGGVVGAAQVIGNLAGGVGNAIWDEIEALAALAVDPERLATVLYEGASDILSRPDVMASWLAAAATCGATPPLCGVALSVAADYTMVRGSVIAADAAWDELEDRAKGAAVDLMKDATGASYNRAKQATMGRAANVLQLGDNVRVNGAGHIVAQNVSAAERNRREKINARVRACRVPAAVVAQSKIVGPREMKGDIWCNLTAAQQRSEMQRLGVPYAAAGFPQWSVSVPDYPSPGLPLGLKTLGQDGRQMAYLDVWAQLSTLGKIEYLIARNLPEHYAHAPGMRGPQTGASLAAFTTHVDAVAAGETKAAIAAIPAALADAEVAEELGSTQTRTLAIAGGVAVVVVGGFLILRSR